MAITASSTFAVTLSALDGSLAEVVVVGYGTQRKGAVTSSIARIKGDQIANQPLPSFDKALGGQAAGVNVTLGSGLVNAEPRIRIRGVNSLTGGRDPLFVTPRSMFYPQSKIDLNKSVPGQKANLQTRIFWDTP